MKTVILTEKQMRFIVDKMVNESTLINEQVNKKESTVVNFQALWSAGKWKLTPQQIGSVNEKLSAVLGFIQKHKGSDISIQIEAGESQVTNFDREASGNVQLKPGDLSRRRGQQLATYLKTYFQRVVGKYIDKMPTFPEPKIVIGQTPYDKANGDAKNPQKIELYKQEQFVRAIITTEASYDCIVGLNVTIGYFPDKMSGNNKHICDEAIFELKMNGVSIGEVNLNNGALDAGETDAKIKYETALAKYNKNAKFYGGRFAKVYPDQANNEKRKAEFIRSKIGDAPKMGASKKITPEIAARKGFKTPEEYMNAAATITKSFASYGRKSDGKVGGARSQTFTIDTKKAQAIINANAGKSIVLSIVPLVSKDGKYKIFHYAGSHSETPYVIIQNKTGETLYQGEPNVGMKRGDTTETVLLQTDTCGKPLTNT